MSKCKRLEPKQIQTKEAMIAEIARLLHTSSYLHVRAILCMLKKWNASGEST